MVIWGKFTQTGRWHECYVLSSLQRHKGHEASVGGVFRIRRRRVLCLPPPLALLGSAAAPRPLDLLQQRRTGLDARSCRRQRVGSRRQRIGGGLLLPLGQG